MGQGYSTVSTVWIITLPLQGVEVDFPSKCFEYWSLNVYFSVALEYCTQARVVLYECCKKIHEIACTSLAHSKVIERSMLAPATGLTCCVTLCEFSMASLVCMSTIPLPTWFEAGIHRQTAVYKCSTSSSSVMNRESFIPQMAREFRNPSLSSSITLDRPVAEDPEARSNVFAK